MGTLSSSWSTGELSPTVLLVEDDMDTLDMYEIYLNSVGYRVATYRLPS